MTIPWTKCSERMPKVDSDIICKNTVNSEWYLHIKASSLYLIGKDRDISQTKWTPYTPEAWAELNKK